MDHAPTPERSPSTGGPELPDAPAAELDPGPLASLTSYPGTPPPSRYGLLEGDWQKAFYVVFTLLGCLALLWVLWQGLSHISGILVLFLLSAVLAFVLAAPVDALSARGGRRLLAILAVYLLVGVVLVGGLVLIAHPLSGQAAALLDNLPQYQQELASYSPALESALGRFGVATSVDELQARAGRALQDSGAQVLGNLVGSAAEIGGLLTNSLLALVISFYLLLDGRRLLQSAGALVPAAHQATLRFVEENVARVLGGYLRGQLVIAATVGLLAGAGCGVLGLPYALVLGVLAGLFALIPMFGPFLSAAPGVLVALFQPFPTVLWVLLFFFAIQQFAFNILGPRITGQAVGLNPLGALFALLVGFQVAGVLGGLFAVPVAGLLWVLLATAYRHRGASADLPAQPSASTLRG
jgi:predicted PurR-regulated permease PerM